MEKFAELEIDLRRRNEQEYSVEFRFNPPEGDAEVRLLRDKLGTVTADSLAELRALESDANAYGAALGKALFRDPLVAVAFVQARSAAQGADAILRVRLLLDPGAPELNAIRWELLRDLGGDRLFTGEQILFSRYLSSLDWRPARLQPHTQLKALVAIANPSNLENYAPGGGALAAVDVAGELERARKALDGISVTHLERATLNGIASALREGYDILYLVCHGAMIEGEPRVWLENDDGKADVASGANVVDRFRELSERPRLVVLASCQSAGTSRGSRDSSMAALGPRLAEAGVPAVLAMQGNLSMETEALFMPSFFRELLRYGQIDRAVALARGAVRHRPDYWVPLLYMRLRSGRLWEVEEDPPAPAEIAPPRPSRHNLVLAGVALAAVAVAGGSYFAWGRRAAGPRAGDAIAEFLNPRPEGSGGEIHPKYRLVSGQAAVNGPATLLGVTLWRLRPAKPEDRGARLLVLEQDKTSAELLPERAETGVLVSEGEKVRLTVESPQPGYLYVIDRESYSDGTFSDAYLIYPNRQTRPGDNALAPGRLIEIPDQRDPVNAFTMRSSRVTQVAEVLSMLVTPAPLAGVQIANADTGTKIDAATYRDWESKWSVMPEQHDLEGGAGSAWTDREKQAGIDHSSLLSRSDAPPQTLYRVPMPANTPFLITVRIGFKK